MADATRIAHAVVVLLAVGAYSVVLLRGLNSQLSQHMYSKIETEFEKNPHMKKDYNEYKIQLEEQKRQKEQMKELEEQAKKIQEQLQELAKKKSQPLKYVQMEGLHDIDRHHKEPHPNQSREQPNRVEL